MLIATNGRIKVKVVRTGEEGITIEFEDGLVHVDFGSHAEWMPREELIRMETK
jgi:hypothetical protein